VKVLFLVNASASAVTARARVVIQKALSADHEVTAEETSRRGLLLRSLTPPAAPTRSCGVGLSCSCRAC
jgi:hypothetical protein